MKYKEIEVFHTPTGKRMKYICLNYEQFLSDCDVLTADRYKPFSINPKNRFEARIDKITDEIIYKVRNLPCRFCICLDCGDFICICRIDYAFELVGKDFLKEDIRGSEIPEDTLKACLKSDIDFIVLYIGMNR